MGRILVTRGEELYEFMCTHIESVPELKVIDKVNNFARRTTRFLEFIDGTIRFHAFARAIQLGRTVNDRDDLDSYSDKSRELQRLCLELLEIGEHNCADIKSFLNLIFDAVAQSKKEKISRQEKQAVLNDYRHRRTDLKCYMCGNEIDISEDQYLKPGVDFSSLSGDPEQVNRIQAYWSRQANPRFVEYDHIWPRSLGGDSTRGNLLPICHFCNREKRNIVSWEWALVQSAVWPPTRGDERNLETVTKQVKVALHLRAALRVAETFGLTLKEAFLHLGPRQQLPRTTNDNDTADFFNLEVHDQAKLGSLWE